MTKNKKNQEFKIRKIRRNIEYSFRGSDRYFYLFIVFLVAGIVLWAVMHVIFDVCIDSWMADPKLLNFQYMWNVLMKSFRLRYGRWQQGFLLHFFCPQCAN